MNAESRKLARLYREVQDVRVKERYHALFMLSLDYSTAETARLMLRDPDTIRAWQEQWERTGTVEDEPRSGRPKKLRGKWIRMIPKLVEEDDPKKHGLNVASWDCKELQHYLTDRDVQVSQECIRKILKAEGFRYVKTAYVYGKADRREQRAFIRTFESMRSSAKRHILFLDEMRAKLHPKQGYKWTREARPIVVTHDSHKSVTVMGAVSPHSGRVMVRTAWKNNAQQFIAFLVQLLQRTRKKLLLFLDGYRVHRSKEVRWFLQQHKRIELRFLPKYSPQLNPIEHLWGYLRQKRINNTEFFSRRSLQKSLEHYFRGLDAVTVRSVCSTRCIAAPG